VRRWIDKVLVGVISVSSVVVLGFGTWVTTKLDDCQSETEELRIDVAEVKSDVRWMRSEQTDMKRTLEKIADKMPPGP